MPARTVSRAALGRAVRQVRIERGATQELVADAAGIHVTYLSGIERGRRNPTIGVVNALAGALDVDTLDLLAMAIEND